MRTMNLDDYEKCPGCGAMVPRGRTADCPICVLKQIMGSTGPTPGDDDSREFEECPSCRQSVRWDQRTTCPYCGLDGCSTCGAAGNDYPCKDCQGTHDDAVEVAIRESEA